MICQPIGAERISQIPLNVSPSTVQSRPWQARDVACSPEPRAFRFAMEPARRRI